MVFSSVTFLLVFLPITAVLYYIPSVFLCPFKLSDKKRSGLIIWKNTVLCLASLIFYAWGEPINIALMLLSIVFNFAIGLDIDKHSDSKLAKKLLLAFAVIFNIGMLGFFKYSGFIAENLGLIIKTKGSFCAPSLPIGISFYTFQILSYVIDVYNKKTDSQKSIISFALYISMFPQLIAGPIVQYSSIARQLTQRRESIYAVSDGIFLFAVGLTKKVFFANTAGAVYEQLTGIGFSKLSALGAWSAIIFYAFQIYFDFSGYSDMARGLGLIFGFEFPENFNYPYTADSITDFWRRWHITLSSWFRDYVYIPLGGSRCSKARTVFNLFVVWALTGLWHGASWNFVLWGIYYFVLLVLEKFVFKKVIEALPRFIRHIVSLVLILFGWVLFASTDLAQIASFTKCLLGHNGASDSASLYLLASNTVMLITMAVFSTNLFDIKESRKKMNGALKFILLVIMLFISIISLIGDTYNPFLYFRF